MKKDLLPSKTIELLNQTTLLYKKDLSLYITSKSTQQNSSIVINKAIKDGLIAYKKLGNEYVVYLTKLGKSNLNSEPIYSKDFHTTDEEVLSRRLQENTIKVLFSICDIPAFENEKIPLEDLRNSILRINKSPLQIEQAKSFLEKGAYYTSKEYVKFVNSVSQAKSDTFVGTRFKGVFISNNNCFFVYMPERGDNKILRINYEKEKNLKASAEVLKNFTNIYRDVQQLYTYKPSKSNPSKLIPASKVVNEPFALVVSDGNAQVYSMATGNPSGLIKNVDFSKIIDKKKRAAELRAEEEADKENRLQLGIARTAAKVKYGQMFLDAYNDIYKHLFVVPRNINGARALNYLCYNTLEDWHYESLDLFKTNPKYFRKSTNPVYPYVELVDNRKIPAIYLPVYDVCILRSISEKEYSPTIVTYEDMLDTIAHSTRKKHRFYDADFYKDDVRTVASLFDEDSVHSYDYSGYTKGEKRIRQYLEDHGLEPLDKNIFAKLPSTFEMDSVSFYNAVAKERISLRKIVSSIDTVETESVKQKRNRKKMVGMHASSEHIMRIKKAAKYKGLSVSQYLMKITYDTIMKDYAEANEYLQKMKREWAKEKYGK